MYIGFFLSSLIMFSYSFKNNEEGVEIMCEIVDEYANKIKEEALEASIRNVFLNGGSLDLVRKAFTTVSEDIISHIYEETRESLQVS